ncbi:MAG TPA: GTP cyclohydrolase I [Thermomicrobiales bacterium]|nr:GTP cyclohydrolase I [Thermomicrobiales bacterium]
MALHPIELIAPGAALELNARTVSDDQLRRFEGYMAEIFAAFRMDVGSPSTADTPRRFVRALLDATAGYDGDEKLLTAFDTECDGGPDCHLSQIIEGPISFYALCEHHALPFFGRAYVGYTARDQIIGISKLIRLVRVFARRFTVQERIGQQIADALEAMLAPHGVAVYLEANHLCTQMRGVREGGPLTRTTVWRGDFAADPALRSDFLTACGLR